LFEFVDILGSPVNLNELFKQNHLIFLPLAPESSIVKEKKRVIAMVYFCATLVPHL
jgi:hypothetical protein